MPEQYTYQVGKIHFIVTPVYKDKRSGETMEDILLKLMLADLENDPGTDGGEDGGVREPSHVIGWWVYLLGGILGLTIGAVLALMI